VEKDKRKPLRGLTLIEIVVVLTIVAVLVTIFVANLAGTKSQDHIGRGIQMVYDDLITIRSRALSTNADHRMNFLSTTQWKIQSYDTVAANWVDVGDERIMPADTYLTSSTFTNAGTNLQAAPRGLFTFLNGATGTPYVTVSGLGAATTKSIYVYVGGALEFKVP
jgi:prepilin-type N-terminal cleavage/methylation domain-containing protein